MGVDDGLGEDHAEDGEGTQEDDDDGEEVRGVPVAGLLSELMLDVHIDRQECRDEHAAHDELVEHVGEVVRDLVGAGKERGPQGEGHGPGAREPCQTGEDHAKAHQRGGGIDGCAERCALLAFLLYGVRHGPL